VAENFVFEIAPVVGIAWGYLFVIVIAGCSLILSWYVKKGKLIVRSPFGLPKEKKKRKQRRKTRRGFN